MPNAHQNQETKALNVLRSRMNSVREDVDTLCDKVAAYQRMETTLREFLSIVAQPRTLEVKRVTLKVTPTQISKELGIPIHDLLEFERGGEKLSTLEWLGLSLYLENRTKSSTFSDKKIPLKKKRSSWEEAAGRLG